MLSNAFRRLFAGVKSPAATPAILMLAASAFIAALPAPRVCAASPVVMADSSVFASQNGYALTVPAGWTQNTSGMMGTDIAMLLPPKHRFATNIIVLVDNLAPGFTMKQVAADWVRQQRALRTNYVELSAGLSQVDDLPAYHTVSTASTGTPAYTIKSEEYAVIRNGRLFEFVYTALPSEFPRHEAQFQAVRRSVNWH